MKIMLTGARGNLGGELIKQSDFEFVQLNREDWKNRLDDKFSEGVKVVVHAASDLRTRVATSPTSIIESNLLLTSCLLEAARNYKVKRFIFISSCSVYGEDMRTSENRKCCPVSLNGIAKLLNEKMIEEFCTKNNIKYEILRVFNMYGGEDRFSILSHIKKSIESKRPFVLNNQGKARRDFIHVSDVASVIQYILIKGMPFTHLNIGTGIATKISTIIDLIKINFPDLEIQVKTAPDIEYSCADITKLTSLRSWEFMSIENYARTQFCLGNLANH